MVLIAGQCFTRKFKVILFVLLITVVELTIIACNEAILLEIILVHMISLKI